MIARGARGRWSLGAVLALGGCRGMQTMLDPAGDQARHIDLTWRTMLSLCGVIYVLVLAYVAWGLWRARARSAEAAAAPQPGRSPAARGPERDLTGWVALLVAGLVLLVTVSFLIDRSLAEVAPNPLRIKVTANQWWWQVEYQGATPSRRVTTANELHLPLGRPAVIELHAHDVIHSFWAPSLAAKTDLIPGRTNYLAVTPRRLGVFRGQCGELCGLDHALMAFDVHVETPAAFEAWRASQRQPAAVPVDPEAQKGQEIFNSKACARCHAIQGSGDSATFGPDLTHLESRDHIAAGALPNTSGDLQAWIADPQRVKPGTTMPRVGLSSDELQALTAYLETLK